MSLLRFKIVVFLDKNGKWLWHLKSFQNGRIIAHSESYSSRTKAMKTAKLIHQHLNNSVIFISLGNNA